MFRFDPQLSSAVTGPLSPEALAALDHYWRAANYLTVGQIYLQDNPLLREPLWPEHIKPRLLGHWGTSPGLNLIYAHLNRLIRKRELDAIYLAGPGHGGPALLANVYLEGTYSEIYPAIARDTAGMLRLFRQFSTPGGVPSHVSVPTPGSIHEGGELGYVLAHAFGAVLDNPDLLAVAVVGDGESETGPLAGSWKSVDFLDPARDGAVLPILHLNGYKIASPTISGRTPDARLFALFAGYGYEPLLVAGDEPEPVHQRLAAALDYAADRLAALRRGELHGAQRRWPMILLRTPKGWTGPKEWNGVPIEGTFRAHQVPLKDVRSNPAQLAALETWMRSYKPEELFDGKGAPQPAITAWAPQGDRRMGANPHANGGKLLHALQLPDWHAQALPVPQPAREHHESTRQLGRWLRELVRANTTNFLLTCPDELASNRLDDVLTATGRRWALTRLPFDDHLDAEGRVFEVLSEHLCEGWLEGYLLTGRHGLFATYEAFAMIAASMLVQHTKWLEASLALPWRAPVAPLNLLLTSTCWRQDHNGFSHQGPGLIDVLLSKRGTVARIYFPPDANSLLALAQRCFTERNTVNLLVIDKQPQLQWLDAAAAEAHAAAGASAWDWASTPEAEQVDVVLAACGDVPTLETVAAAWWLRHYAPELRLRVVNICDLMCLFTPDVHPHGLSEERFAELFTASKHVIFAFHGYQRAVHSVLHGRPHADRFHVRGFVEQGTTTTPFDMVALNHMSRFDLAAEALRRAYPEGARRDALVRQCEQAIRDAVAYAGIHFEDAPEIRNWTWTEPVPLSGAPELAA
ncbi:MAG: phosphoketolase family protein [Acidobacteria bacterium]|nr:MAG: phosphoketolase family protein [Acidobacteriota bacterium]